MTLPTSETRSGRRRFSAGSEATSEDWTYGCDDKNQLTSDLASFSNASPAVVGPGLQFGYIYDDIGNRTQIVQGDALTGSGAYRAAYIPNALNQYDSRTVPGKIEVTGCSLATDSSTSDRR